MMKNCYKRPEAFINAKEKLFKSRSHIGVYVQGFWSKDCAIDRTFKERVRFQVCFWKMVWQNNFTFTSLLNEHQINFLMPFHFFFKIFNC